VFSDQLMGAIENARLATSSSMIAFDAPLPVSRDQVNVAYLRRSRRSANAHHSARAQVKTGYFGAGVNGSRSRKGSTTRSLTA